jgi:hypothetical protein
VLRVTAVLAVAACTRPAPPVRSDAQAAVDSVVLERTRCFGTCPAYRLSVRANGFVTFASRNPGDEGRTESLAREPDIVRRIERELDRAQFAQLPAMTLGEPPYCRIAATDAPIITVSAFGSRDTRSVSYYTGCRGDSVQDTLPQHFIRRLRVLADSIDSIAAGPGWIRPAQRR